MKTKIEKETVDLAINELKLHNKPVNMQSVMDLTGYTRHHLITQGYAYLVRKPKHSINAGPVSIVRPGHGWSAEAIDLEHTVEAYTAHIRDNYFIHAETIKDVELTMLLEVAGFQTEIYRTAINLLMLSKELQPHTVKPDHYIGNFAVDAPTASPSLVEPEPTPPAAPKTEFLILIEQTMECQKAYGVFELDAVIQSLLENNDYTLKIYQLQEIAQPQRVINRKRIH